MKKIKTKKKKKEDKSIYEKPQDDLRKRSYLPYPDNWPNYGTVNKPKFF